MASSRMQRFNVAALGLVSVIAWGSAISNALFSDSEPRFSGSASRTDMALKEPLTVPTFRRDVEHLSKNNMMVVVLRRNNCPSCDDLSSAFYDARYWLEKKVGAGFATYEVNAEQNPDIAALLRQRDPMAEARLHVFYNGEKIYESKGLTTNPRHLGETLEMVHALAIGEVSIYDKHEPPVVWPVEAATAASAPVIPAPVARP